MKFTKMHGLGNDYVYVNCFDERVEDPARLAPLISDRHRGVGSDGLILIRPSKHADVTMEMYNADGSRGEMCGNGIRCVARYAWEHRLTRNNPMSIETDAGDRRVELVLQGSTVDAVRVDMGVPSLDPGRLPASFEGDRVVDHPFEVSGRTYRITCVSMGNPHVVLFVDDLEAVDLPCEGRLLEDHPVFPQRINVHFVRVASPASARMLTWERGSGATQACGTGACAVAVAGVLTGRLDECSRLELPGGALDIEWRNRREVIMTGPAVEVFSGVWDQPG